MPLVGLLSDSHGRAGTTQQAVRVLVEQGAETLLHLGDVGSEAVIDALVVAGVGSRLVFGNTDYEADSLARYARLVGVAVDDPAGRLELGDKVLVYTHGHLHRAVAGALADGVDYLCHGHTHERLDQRRGATRVINPGALFRATQYTVALLDTDADRVTFYPVDGR